MRAPNGVGLRPRLTAVCTASSRWSARCCCGCAGCWSAGWRRRRPCPRGSPVRVGGRTCPPSRSRAAVGAAAHDEVLRAGLIAFPLVIWPRRSCRGGWSGGCSARCTPSRRRRDGCRPSRSTPARAERRPRARSPSWPRASTRCSTGCRPRSRRSAGSSPTPATSCARRSSVLRTEVDVTLAGSGRRRRGAAADGRRRPRRHPPGRRPDSGLLLLAPRRERRRAGGRGSPLELADIVVPARRRGARRRRPRAGCGCTEHRARRRRRRPRAARAGGRGTSWRTRCGTTSPGAG